MAPSQQTTSDLRSALQRLGVGARSELYISIIDSEAERADIEDYGRRTENNAYGPILDALNAFLRSLRRSRLASDRCQRRIKISPLWRRKNSPPVVTLGEVLAIVPVAHRRDPRCFV